MAVYQVTIFFVPEVWHQNSGSVDALLTDEGCFDASNIWSISSQRDSVKEIFNKTFSSYNKTFWKSEGESDYSIDEDDEGNVECVRARVDGRNYAHEELQRILSLAHVCECVLYFPEFEKILEPSVNALEPLELLVKRSRAYKWKLDKS
ncbi:MAG: hypothetical protein COC04_06385 [Gammaproteobacteria bacterium]|nr:MAG: hypothetical protein COC04_06385 [Gammaproteobacteria bacterium]